MKILLANDDGYESEGLKKLVDYLSKENEVYVMAPSGNRSAVSNCITMYNPTDIVKIRENVWSCSGYPADCTAIGIQSDLFDFKFDVVVSGINMGANMGTDIIYSGTCAVARQAVLNNVPGIAVSVDPVSWEDVHKYGFKFDAIADFVTKNLKTLVSLAKTDVPKAFVNVNGSSIDKYKGVKVTSKLCIREYNDKLKIVHVKDNEYKTEYVFGKHNPEILSDSDLDLCRKGYVVVSRVLAEPVCLDVVDGISFSL